MLDKAIDSHKEHREQYRGSKAIDRTCRNHGTCKWCEDNRLYSKHRQDERISQDIKEYREDINS